MANKKSESLMDNRLHVYGIKNCDTVRKSLKWLSEHDLDVVFHDLKKEALTENLVLAWFKQIDQSKLVNRRGTTWRNLKESEKNLLETQDFIQLIIDNPTLVKRPVVHHQEVWSVGFDLDDWQKRFL
jgi:arsenate reductase